MTQSELPEDPDAARQWSRDNPDLALAWMLHAPAGPQRDVVAELVCAQMAETDPERAVTFAEHYAGNNSNLLANLVQQWCERDEPTARAYALAKPAGEARDLLVGRVALAQAKTDPVTAAQMVIKEMSPGETQNEAVMSVLHQWALRAPNDAMAWAQLFHESELRNRALMELENLRRQPPGH